MANSCDTCAYWEERVANTGFCHRNPPANVVVITDKGPTVVGSHFAMTEARSWCGEWKQGQLVKTVKAMPPLELVHGARLG